MKQTWVFYSYTFDSNIEKFEGEYDCKKPNKTKLWKELENKLHSTTNLETIGYRLKN